MTDTAAPHLRVQAALDRLLPGRQVRRFETSTATSEEAAAACGCPLGAIVKTLAFLVDGDPLLVLAAGDRQVDTGAIAERFGVARKRVQMARPDVVIDATGYAVGGVPPVGHPRPLPALVDRSLERFDQLWAAAGEPNAVFPITLDELLHVTGGQPADCTRERG